MTIKNWPLSFAIAHRGASLLAPENTISALKKAKEQGAHSVECDIQLTRDQQPVIFHDETLARTSNGRGRLCDATLARIQALDAGTWFSADYKDERVPTLEEWLKTAANLKLNLNLEMKAISKKESITLATLLIDHLQKFWPAHSTSLLISSSNQFALMQVAERAKSLPLGFITEKILTEKNAVELNKANIVSVHQLHSQLNQKYIDMLHANDLNVLAYTINDLDRAKELQAMGVDGIFTDNDILFKMPG
ncbi:MAG: glycerophosphodiester phosphodiesterase family protein [Gammaproteobacteria bacterium]|nr:glycerophosphodiester phosphodiesterase family protein [Gammaproteobacteria bacterium]